MSNTTKEFLHNYQKQQIEQMWYEGDRFKGIKRDWTPEDVLRARGRYPELYAQSIMMSRQLWKNMKEGSVRALGAQTPAQAVQMVKAGLKGIYVSGWQVAADANGHMYPDQSLYTHDCVPNLVMGINNALKRQDKIDCMAGKDEIEWLVPCVADAEAGFGGMLNAFELMKRMIEAGAAGVHLEDQLSSEKKCGHLGGKVLVPTQEFINKLKAARFAADVLGVPTILIARTDADSAKLITTDYDERDKPFLTGERTEDGFYRITGGLDQAIQRGLAYAPYADLIWCETSKPDIEEARRFAEAIHAEFPEKMLAYNCSPSFNWSRNLDKASIRDFQDTLEVLGYKFQFITLAGFHALNYSMYDLAHDYKRRGMTSYSELQDSEFEAAIIGYTAHKHQAFVGTGYFDEVKNIITGGTSSTAALKESTEEEQFHG